MFKVGTITVAIYSEACKAGFRDFIQWDLADQDGNININTAITITQQQDQQLLLNRQ